MPLEPRKRAKHLETNGVATRGVGILSIRNIGLGLLVVLVICAWQVILLSSHTDVGFDAGGATQGMWRYLTVHEANITALSLQQRELVHLLGQLNTAVIAQQKELADVEHRLQASSAQGQVGSGQQAGVPDAARLAAQRETLRRLEEEQQRVLSLQNSIDQLKQKMPEQVMRNGQALNGMDLAAMPSARAAPLVIENVPDIGDVDFPADWLKKFSKEELRASAQEAAKWRIMAKKAAEHAWSGYKTRAWGLDEMKPQTGTQGRIWGNCGLQILDAMSTLWIMELHEQFDEGQKWIEQSLNFNHASAVSFFEITIRALGGLASAHSLSGRDIFLQKAKQLADKLLPGFNAATGFPMTQINLKTGQGTKGWYQGTVLAEAGTVQLEFRYLSQQTGDPRYAAAADRSMRSIFQAEAGRGLVPWGLSNTAPVRFANNVITFGAMGDSYYEYLLKMHLQTGKTEPEWKDAWKRAMSKMMDRLIFTTSGGLTYIAEEKNGVADHKMDHLACFVGGMLVYGARQLPEADVDSRWEKTAAGITETCYQMYHRQPSHLAPEATKFDRKGSPGHDINVWNNAAHYLLRPEAAEAIYYMFYYTGDPKYRRMAGEIMEAIEERTKVDWGYSAVADVRQNAPRKRNEMETFFLAETLKYLYLTFLPNPRQVLDFDEWVLTTEAHPLRILKKTAASGFYT